MLAIDYNAAREYVLVNYPNDPLLRTIALSLLAQLPKVEVAPAAQDGGALADNQRGMKL